MKQEEREKYLTRCRAQLKVELGQLEGVKEHDRFSVFKIFDNYCPFDDERGEMWRGMKAKEGSQGLECVLLDSVAWRGEELTFVTLFQGISLNCRLLLSNGEFLLRCRLGEFPVSNGLNQLELLIRSVIWPRLA